MNIIRSAQDNAIKAFAFKVQSKLLIQRRFHLGWVARPTRMWGATHKQVQPCRATFTIDRPTRGPTRAKCETEMFTTRFEASLVW
jgi:hypothetical protein